MTDREKVLARTLVACCRLNIDQLLAVLQFIARSKDAGDDAGS